MSRGKKLFWWLFVIGIVLLVVVISVGGRLPSNSVLVLELGGEIEDQQKPDPWEQLTSPRVTVTHDVLGAIDLAAGDNRIAGLVVKITGSNAGWGKLDEIRAHLLEFQKSGKPNVCYLAGDMPGNREYFLATACAEVWVVPSAALGTVGMMASSTFYRGALDKLGVVPNIYGTGDYKTYRNQFTESKYTPAHREMVESLVGDLYGHYAQAAAQARQMEPVEFDRMLRAGPYLSAEAKEKRLIDRIAHWDEVQDHFRETTGDWKPVGLGRYKEEVSTVGAATVAVINATGSIEMGDSGYDSWDGYVMGADSVAANLRWAREDDSVAAIILRVDSPGGSVVASEIIRREVERAREAKPVVVSMADTAASGGYWISMSANKIVAEPGTITGSIGVVFGKVNVAGLYRLLGLSTDHYATSENATILYEQQNFTPAQRATVERFMQDNYTDFKNGVAKNRGLDPAQIEQIAQGRVWTGTQAKDRGLVDEIGGMNRALELARELAKIDPAEKVRLIQLPEERGLFDALFSWTSPLSRQEQRLKAKLRPPARTRPMVEARLPFELDIR